MHQDAIDQLETENLIDSLRREIADLKHRLELSESRHEPITEDKPMTIAKMRRVMDKNNRYKQAMEDIFYFDERYGSFPSYEDCRIIIEKAFKEGESE